MSESDQRTYAMFLHLSGLAWIVTTVPCAGLIAPLIMWLLKRGESPFIDAHGREAVNFHLSVLIYTAVAIAMTVAFAAVTIGVGVILLVPLWLLLGFAAVVFEAVVVIRAAIFASRGERYRYPLTLRLLGAPAYA